MCDPHLSNRLLVYMMLYTAPNAVVDRVEVEAVGRPVVRRDERWCLTTQKLNSNFVTDFVSLKYYRAVASAVGATGKPQLVLCS